MDLGDERDPAAAGAIEEDLVTNATEGAAAATTAAASTKRLTRRAENKVVGGVAGGLADYFALDPIIFRIGFIGLAIAGGSGLLLYALAWLLIPERGAVRSTGEAWFDRTRGSRPIALILVIIGTAMLLGVLGNTSTFRSPLLWAGALIAIGVLMLKDDGPEAVVEDIDATAGSAPAGDQAAIGSERTVGRTVDRVRTRRLRRRASPLAAYTIGGIFLALGLAATAQSAGWTELTIGQLAALPLMVLGIGVTVAAWWGRAWLLIGLGAIALPLALAASLIDMPLQGSIGDHYAQPTGNLQPDYKILAGGLHLYLDRYDFTPGPSSVDVEIVAGNVEVGVPRGVTVRLHGHVDVGEVRAFNYFDDGSDIAFDETFTKPGAASGTFDLEVDGGATWINLYWVDARGGRR